MWLNLYPKAEGLRERCEYSSLCGQNETCFVFAICLYDLRCSSFISLRFCKMLLQKHRLVCRRYKVVQNLLGYGRGIKHESEGDAKSN